MVARRLLRWYLPLDEATGWQVPLWTLLPAVALVLVYSARQPPPRRIILLLTAASGLAWIFGMEKPHLVS